MAGRDHHHADGREPVAVTGEHDDSGHAARGVVDEKQLAPGWDDLAVVRAIVTNAKGVPVPSATNLITFAIGGPGVIAAVDSADNASHEPFQSHERRAFQGECFHGQGFAEAGKNPGEGGGGESQRGLRHDPRAG